MIAVLHGDDIVRSRKRLTELKKSFAPHEVFQLEGEKTDPADVVQAFESEGLLSDRRLIVLERFIETGDKKLLASVLNHIRGKLSHNVIFWEEGEIKKELLALFPGSSLILFFKKEPIIFKFLDSIRPDNTEASLSLFHKALLTEEEERVFYMLVRQFRLLLGITAESSISEVRRLAPWQRVKLERQARQFTVDRLVALYRKLFQIEREAKTGQNALPFSTSLDLFLASI